VYKAIARTKLDAWLKAIPEPPRASTLQATCIPEFTVDWKGAPGHAEGFFGYTTGAVDKDGHLFAMHVEPWVVRYGL